MTQVIIKSYKGNPNRLISALYQALTASKNSTNYIKEKWEAEFGLEITDKWKMHQTSTSSRAWREFSWKNLVRFFITPKIKNKYSNTNHTCWRECAEIDANHAHIFWKCHQLSVFWEMVYNILQKILGCYIPIDCKTLYMCNLNEGNVHVSDRYLVKMLLIASKKAITRHWCKPDPP